MAIPYFPSEILTNIFVRAPIETLSNLILVNKFCYQLISSPNFAKAHLKISRQGKTTNLSNCRFIFANSSDGRLLKQLSCKPVSSNSSSINNVVNLDFPKDGLQWPDVRLVGSCIGLVCIVVRKEHVFLWNPCTGKYKKLPCLDVDYKERILCINYGFGYDESTDDYKVVALCLFPDEPFRGGDESYHYVVNVFSLKRNSWKRVLLDFEGCVLKNDMGKLVGGKVHWFTCRRSYLVSFDVVNEVFGRVELPSYDDGDCDITLDVLEGCICLLLSYFEQERVDVWVMKEYGVKESWTKIVTVSCVDFSFPIVLPTSEVLFHSTESLAVYNLKDNSFRLLDGVEERGCCNFEPVMYVPNLVSPLV